MFCETVAFTHTHTHKNNNNKIENIYIFVVVSRLLLLCTSYSWFFEKKEYRPFKGMVCIKLKIVKCTMNYLSKYFSGELKHHKCYHKSLGLMFN